MNARVAAAAYACAILQSLMHGININIYSEREAARARIHSTRTIIIVINRLRGNNARRLCAELSAQKGNETRERKRVSISMRLCRTLQLRPSHYDANLKRARRLPGPVWPFIRTQLRRRGDTRTGPLCDLHKGVPTRWETFVETGFDAKTMNGCVEGCQFHSELGNLNLLLQALSAGGYNTEKLKAILMFEKII